jgi:peptide chain release factor 1
MSRRASVPALTRLLALNQLTTKGLTPPIKSVLADISKTVQSRQDLDGMLKGEQEPDMISLIENEVAELDDKLLSHGDRLMDRLEEERFPSPDSAIVEIRPAVGGEEASLFAAELVEMYQRWAARERWRCTSSGNTALGQHTLTMDGPQSYPKFIMEAGTHCVKRVPKTESLGRVHTSTVTVAVLRQPEANEFKLNERELHIEFKIAGGPGGQHRNKTESAVRMTHLPTKITVSIADQRSQHQNLAAAMKIMTARLYERHQAEQGQKRAQERASMLGDGGFTSKIRTYQFPQNRVTDHRLKIDFPVRDFLDAKCFDRLYDEYRQVFREELLERWLADRREQQQQQDQQNGESGR